MKLSRPQYAILNALAAGSFLKSHRALDGAKTYRLHLPDGSSAVVRRSTIAALWDRGLISTNQKFPVAMYWLTDRGRAAIGAPDRSGRA
jgi:hypothetical protein